MGDGRGSATTGTVFGSRWRRGRARSIRATTPPCRRRTSGTIGRFDCSRSGCGRHRRFSGYSRLTADIFAAVRDVSGRPVIVDSSKNPSRALALALNPAVDLRMVTLVRDARGVAWSLKKGHDTPSRPVWRTALFWAWCNVNVSWVAACLPPDRHTFVRYEDFVAAPDVALTTIGSLFGLDLSDLASRVMSGEPMTIGHNIAGNLLRMRGSVRLSPDFQWRSKLSRADQLMIWSIAGPQMFWYGYRR